MRCLTMVILATLAFALLRPVSASPLHLNEREVADLVEVAQGENNPEATRAKAIRQLEHTDIRTQLSVLRRLLREERSLDIRLAAACTLAALGDRKAPRDLLLASAYDGDHTASCSRSDVLVALARVGDPAAEMHLEKALKTDAPPEEPYYYNDACRALAILNTTGSRRLLLAAIRDGAPPVRHAAIEPLAGVALDARSPDRAAARETLVLAARTDPDEKVAEQAASALLWSGVDGTGFFRLLESDPDAAVRARAARVMNRHYLSPARLARLRGALSREKDPSVRGAIQATLQGQKPK